MEMPLFCYGGTRVLLMKGISWVVRVFYRCGRPLLGSDLVGRWMYGGVPFASGYSTPSGGGGSGGSASHHREVVLREEWLGDEVPGRGWI